MFYEIKLDRRDDSLNPKDGYFLSFYIEDGSKFIGSDRCYKKAWEIEKVLEFIKEQRGKHFDPKLVDIFFDNLDDILKIKEEHQDI